MTLIAALICDALFGEPKWLWSRIPHPVVLIGRLISWAERSWNTGPHKKRNGILLVVLLSVIAIVMGFTPKLLTWGWAIDILFAAVLFAHRSLVDHVSAVASALDQSLEKGRASVAMIVGRDTAHMDQSAVARGAIESAAENMSDGVVAPVLWFACFGLPGLLFYKTINTADSMIGYLTPRYREFGWAAARLDDVLNWVPARLTALLFAATGAGLSQWSAIAQDAKRHRSPNAGWPEAAMARSLKIALSGPRSYEGKQEEQPYVNSAGRKALSQKDIRESVSRLWSVWWCLLACAVLGVASVG